MWLRLRTMWWSWPHLIICSVEQGRRGTHLSVSFRPLFSGPGFALEIRARIWWRSFVGNLSWSFKLRPLCFLGLLSMRQLAPVWASKFLLELVAFSFLARWIASWKLAATFVLGKCWFGWRGLIHNLLPCDVGWWFFFFGQRLTGLFGLNSCFGFSGRSFNSWFSWTIGFHLRRKPKWFNWFQFSSSKGRFWSLGLRALCLFWGQPSGSSCRSSKI